MKQGDHDSKKRVAFPILLPEGMAFAEKTGELHVVPTGKWDHPVYGEMEITPAHIREFVKNFKDKVRRDIPITAGHDNGMNGGELPAIGWFKELYDRGVNGLWAVVEWTEEGARMLQERQFKYFSPEFYETYEDPEDGKRYSHVLVGGALTNKPYFKELEAPVLAFSEPVIMNQFSELMDLKDILAKKPEELSDEEKKHVNEHKDELTDEQKSAFASVLDDGAGSDDGEDDGDGADDGDDDGSNDGDGSGDGAPVVTAAEKSKGKKILMSEGEVAALKRQADEGAKAFAEIEKMKLNDEVSKLVFSDRNTTGKILPKQKDAVVKFMRCLSEPQRDQFRSIIVNLPKADASMFAEIGDTGSDAAGADALYAQIKTKANDLIRASEGKLKFSDAVKEVYKLNPGLKTQYENALNGN